MSDIKTLFGEHLRTLRRQRDWTQELLAEKADLHVTYIIALEKGKKNASIETLKKIADAFEMTLPELFVFDAKAETVADREVAALMREYTDKITAVLKQ
ncbi:helix-turn-helix transcriptional regulator [Ruminococcaceae bacterium OttesenSCG-928-A11]|nr:helix-turn-helix transcriptional regulator [Ruminococcaceae bacterium OttesenSCG-928-A11]